MRDSPQLSSQRKGNFEIGRVLHWKSEIPKSQIGLQFRATLVQSEISDLGFPMQDSSNFEIPPDASRRGLALPLRRILFKHLADFLLQFLGRLFRLTGNRMLGNTAPDGLMC